MKGCISSGSIYTSEAGHFAFEQGGNAFDALIAAQLAACVAEPLLTGLGGAGLAVLKHKGDYHCVDMFTTMPEFDNEKWTPEKLDEIILDFGTTTQRFHVGRGSIATPTVPQGLLLIHQQYATLPMETLIKPACKLAEEGFIINQMSEYILDLLHPIYAKNPLMMQWYSRSGQTLRVGQRCCPVEMKADFMKFAKFGEKFWEMIVPPSFSLHNSILKSISKYKAKITKPLETSRDNYNIFVPPMPSIGGYIASGIIQNLETVVSSEDLQAYTNLTENLVKQGEHSIQDSFAHGGSGFTTHISVVDELGNAASLTTSLGETSGYTIPGTGIVLNNFLGEADVAHPLAVQHSGSRLVTMCTPMILEMNDEIAAIGSGGSSRIPHALAQVVMRYTESSELSWHDAIEAPRYYPNFDENFELCMEQHGLTQNFLKQCEQKFGQALKIFEEPSMYFGGVHVAGIQHVNGLVQFTGGADQRRQGSLM